MCGWHVDMAASGKDREGPCQPAVSPLFMITVTMWPGQVVGSRL